MPEGHTVHRLADAFQTHFQNKRVAAASPQGRFADGAAALHGRTLRAAEAHGKQMFLRFGRDLWLRVHLGLYGMWRFHGDGIAHLGRRTRRPTEPQDFPPPPQGAVRLRLETLHHAADLSGPAACELLDPHEKQAFMTRLGEDPLRPDANPDRAYAKLHASRAPLAQLLMRQDIVAGIGNIYRAELLFRARLDPFRPGKELTEPVFASIWDDLTHLLRDGVRTGRILTTSPADRSRTRRSHYVAHRAGDPCLVCGNEIQSAPLAGRTLYWCGHCQTG